MRVNRENLVIEAAEKRPISRLATTGIFWFRSVSSFVSATQEMIRNDGAVDGIFYVAPTLNELVLKGKKIAIKTIDRDSYHPMKSERQFSDAEHYYGTQA